MGFLFKDKDMRFLVFLGLAIFVVTGFMWEPMKKGNLQAYSVPDRTNDPKLLKEIDWKAISPEIENYITQSYGNTNFAAASSGLRDHRHNGIDINASAGASILSQSKGRVFFVGNQDVYCGGKGYGRFVMIENSRGGFTLLYAHLSKVEVSIGDNVDKGDIIGYVGTTGLATGPHLHFSVFKTDLVRVMEDKPCGPNPKGGDINPLDYLKD